MYWITRGCDALTGFETSVLRSSVFHDTRDFQRLCCELLDPDLHNPLPSADILVGVLQHPRAQGRLTVIAGVDPQLRPVLATMTVVLSILL